MRWEDRIANYARETGFPPAMGIINGRAYGLWVMGNNYQVKSKYYGGYPATYLRRVRALFPEKRCALHLFSGHVDTDEWPGDTVDTNGLLCPTFVDDAQTLKGVPLERYDIVLADPPYSVEDCEHYGTTMVKRNRVMRALARVEPGTHVIWLDQVLPMYRKDTWEVEADIGMRKSTNHRFRCVTVFCRK